MSVFNNPDGSVTGGAVPEAGNMSALGLTAAKTVQAKRVCRVSVTVAGSAAGTVADGATGTIAAIPNALGVTILDWPVLSGSLVITPGTGQTVSVSYAN